MVTLGFFGMLLSYLLLYFLTWGQAKNLMYIEPDYPFVPREADNALQMRVLTPVELQLFDARHDPCDSFSLYATAGWMGSGKRMYAFSERRAKAKMHEAAVRATSEPGEAHDFMSACIRSAVGIDDRSNYDFVMHVLESLDPPQNENMTEQARLWYAVGVATGYGGEPIFRFKAAHDIRNYASSLLEWEIGMGPRVFSFISPENRETYINASCQAFELTGMSANVYEECCEDMGAFIRWLMTEAETDGSHPPMTADYIFERMDQDVRTRREMGAEFSTEAIENFLNGQLAQFKLYREFMLSFNFDVPQLKTIPHWTRIPAFIHAMVEKMRVDPFELSLQRIRLLLFLNGMQFTAALTHPEMRARSDDFLRETSDFASGLPAWILRVNPGIEPEENLFIRDSEVTTMMHSKITEQCMWLTSQYLPNHVNRAYRENVPDTRQDRLADMFKQLQLAALKMIHQSELSRADRHRLTELVTQMQFEIGVEETREFRMNVTAGAPLVQYAFAARSSRLINDLYAASMKWARPVPADATHPLRAYYDMARNTVVMPPGLAQYPFMSDTWKSSALFGMIAPELGREMLRAMNISSEGIECFATQYAAYPTPQHKNAVNGTRVAFEAALDVGGLTLALRAYETKINGNVPTEDLREFVDAYTQMGAENSDARTERVVMAGSTFPPSRARQDGALRNLYDQSGRHVMERIHSCLFGSNMHPRKTCNIFRK